MENEWIEKSVPKERRTWIKGKIIAKCKSKVINDSELGHEYQNVFEIQKVLESKIELTHTLTEAKTKQSIIKGAHTRARLDCALKLPSKIQTFATSNVAQYQLQLNELRFTKPPKISNVLIEEGNSFALYEGVVVGYIKDTIYETKQILKESVSQAKKEVKPPVLKIPPPTAKPHKRSSPGFASGCLGSIQSIIGFLFLAFIIISVLTALGRNVLWVGLAALIIYLLSRFGNQLAIALGFIFRIFWVLLFLGMIAAFISDVNRGNNWHREPENDPQEYKKTEVVEQDNDVFENSEIFDTVIVQSRRWKDYDGNSYATELKIRTEDLTNAANYRNNMNSVSGFIGFNKVYYDLLEQAPDKSFKYVYSNLDTIRVNRALTRGHFAEVIVSMVQDIPYTLILPQECNWQTYQDKFIKDYLQAGNECVPYIKYGLFSPEEFIANLKGDCDTRTLILFKILHHYQYDVRIVNSEKHGHSILAINSETYSGNAFIFDHKRYVTWETTTENSRPGTNFENLDNQYHWKTALY
jgi:hypothetical protein